MVKISKLLIKILEKKTSIIDNIYRRLLKEKMGFCGKNVDIRFNSIYKPEHIFLSDNTNIFEGFTFISDNGCFYMKENSGAAQGLTVITDTHSREVGHLLKDSELFYKGKGNISSDVIVEEDVWIGANVTLLPGSRIGRGANIGANAVVRSKIPPYSIVIGNPAKIVGFCFSPNEIIEHERNLYPEDKRLSIEDLNKQYKKYFLDRFKENKNLVRP